MGPDDVWCSWEREVKSFEDLISLTRDLHSRVPGVRRRLVWRGQKDAAWALHSSLYRKIVEAGCGRLPDEAELYDREAELLREAHEWGLHFAGSSRLSMLHQLALHQHYGTPTRLIDVTFNPLVAAWFAVAGPEGDGSEADGRIFAMDVSERQINQREDLRRWADDPSRPWPSSEPSSKKSRASVSLEDWCTSVYAWRPAALDPRVAAQSGAFVFGGVPSSSFRFPSGLQPSDGCLTSDHARAAVSVPLRVHSVDDGSGPHPGAVYTARIASEAKREIRATLEDVFDLTYSTLFPDLSGFAEFGPLGRRVLPRRAA